MYFLGYFARRRTSSFYPTAQSLRLGTFFPYWDDLLTPYPGSMFLLLGFFLPQEVEQIVRLGLPPGYTYEPCIQFPEGFFDLPELLFAGIIRFDTVFVEQLPVGVGAVDLFREACKPS